MAEVVEVNLISKDILSNEIIFQFIHEQAEIKENSKVVEVMDNWEYENSYIINPKEYLQYLINSKIISITEKARGGYVGLNIEKIDNNFCYTIWFNLKKYEAISGYYQLIKALIAFVKQKINRQFILCAIGKEVVFEFQGDYNVLLNNSHNIDVWVYLGNLFDFEKGVLDSKLISYKLVKVDDYKILIKSNI